MTEADSKPYDETGTCEALRASARHIFTLSAKPAEAYPPSLICSRRVLWQARALKDTLFAFILALPEGAFCEGG